MSERLYVGIAHPHLGASLLKQFNHLQHRRLPVVIDILLIGDAKQVDTRTANRLLVLVQNLANSLHDELGHRIINLSGKLNKPGMVVIFPSLPG
ncbi:hypothetical protein D3C85_1349730 [compost metagenome]